MGPRRVQQGRAPATGDRDRTASFRGSKGAPDANIKVPDDFAALVPHLVIDLRNILSAITDKKKRDSVWGFFDYVGERLDAKQAECCVLCFKALFNKQDAYNATKHKVEIDFGRLAVLLMNVSDGDGGLLLRFQDLHGKREERLEDAVTRTLILLTNIHVIRVNRTVEELISAFHKRKEEDKTFAETLLAIESLPPS